MSRTLAPPHTRTVATGACLAAALSMLVVGGCGQELSPQAVTEPPAGSPSETPSATPTPAPRAPTAATPTPTTTPSPTGQADTQAALREAPALDPAEATQVLTDASALCQGKGSIASTPAYDPGTDGPHPVLVLTGSHDSDYRWFAWTPVPEPGAGIATLDQYAQVQLVACIDRRDGLDLARVCPVEESEDRTVEMYNAASYHVTVYAAATGERVAEASLTDSEPQDCPLSVIFSGDQPVVRLYASPSEDSLRTFLDPLVNP